MTTLAPPASRKFPVWQTVGTCYATVARNFGQLVRISWLWLLIAFPIHVALLWLEQTWREDQDATNLPSSLASVLEIAVTASIAVAWHRLILRQERMTALAYLRLDRTVCFYALYLILLGLLMLPLLLTILLVAIPIGLLDIAQQAGIAVRKAFALSDDPDQIASLLVTLPMTPAVLLLVLPRLSLMLPAIAVGERLTLRQSWRSTRANTLRLALATLLCVLPGFLPMLLALLWPWIGSAEGQGSDVIGELTDFAGFFFFSIFGVTLLSLTYRFFVERRGEGVSPAP